MSETTRHKRLLAGLTLWTILAAPPVRALFEALLVTHVLIELVGLIIAGYWIGMALREPLRRALAEFNPYGATTILIALTTGIFWMLPRWLDASLDITSFALAKFLSVPLLLGLPLALGWQKAGPILRGFLKANFISMLAVLSWLYIVSPVRLCNNYLESDQTNFGIALGLIALGLSVLWSVPLFFVPGNQKNSTNHTSALSSGFLTNHEPNRDS